MFVMSVLNKTRKYQHKICFIYYMIAHLKSCKCEYFPARFHIPFNTFQGVISFLTNNNVMAV